MGDERGLTGADGAGGREKERLEPSDLVGGSLLAASHVHRYQLAAGLCGSRRVLDLCCGTGYGVRLLATKAAAVHGVDISDEALATARSEVADLDRERVSFEQADALAYLRRLPQGRFDAVVCFEGLEHVVDADAVVSELVRLTEGGAQLILSLPNSRGFEETNEFHVTDFGYEEMRAVADRFQDAAVFAQYFAEASLVLPPDAAPGAQLLGRVLETGVPEAAPQAWANHWLLLVGVGAARIEQAQAALALAAVPHHNEYMRHLERANAELHRANARMGRAWLGVHDAAAATAEARRTELEQRVAELERQLDGERRASHEMALRHEAAMDVPRYRVVDALRTLAFTVPGVGTALRLRSGLIQRRNRAR